MLTEPVPRERWGGVFRELAWPDPLPEPEATKLMICRLAADGLWLLDLLGHSAMTPALRAGVVRQRECMTRDEGS